MVSLVEPDDSFFETQRSSLLDSLLDRNRALNKKGLLHRMVLISRMSHNNFGEIGQHYEKLFKELLSKHQTEPITGLLLLYPKHCVHVVESSPEMLTDLLRDIRSDMQNNDNECHMEKSKIVIISHDIPHRLYQQWGYRILDIEAPNLDEYDPSDETEGLVSEMLVQLLKLGSFINKQPKMGMKNAAESLHDKVPELLPQQDVIGYLLDRDDRVTLTIDEHLDRYEKPYTFIPASEKVWPMPVRLFPYN